MELFGIYFGHQYLNILTIFHVPFKGWYIAAFAIPQTFTSYLVCSPFHGCFFSNKIQSHSTIES